MDRLQAGFMSVLSRASPGLLPVGVEGSTLSPIDLVVAFLDTCSPNVRTYLYIPITNTVYDCTV